MTERGMERERHTMKRKCIFFTLVELIIVIVCTCILFLAWTLYEEYVLHPKELDRELVCACYLQQIYKACHQYSLSNDGRFPCARSVPDPKTSEWASKTDCCEDFELLRTQYLDDSKMFLCPDNAENPQKTKLTEAYLFESTHGDVGGPTKKRNKKRNQAGLHWMVHQAQKSSVKMKDVPVNYIVIKEN